MALGRASIRRAALGVWSRFAVPFLLCSMGFAAESGPQGKAPKDPHIHGVAHLHLSVQGRQVAVTLLAPAATMIGFEHRPATAEEGASLSLATQNLKIGDAMIRLNTQAGCELANASVSAPLTAPAPSVDSKDDTEADPEADLRADYRFDCAQPERLDSAALGIFSGFPFLQRVLVYYQTKDGKGRAELTPNNPVVTFVPF